jgi:hypothetical protein
MVRSVAREYNWPPKVIGGLFLDRRDYKGLYYWYDAICDNIKRIKDNNKRK